MLEAAAQENQSVVKERRRVQRFHSRRLHAATYTHWEQLKEEEASAKKYGDLPLEKDVKTP